MHKNTHLEIWMTLLLLLTYCFYFVLGGDSLIFFSYLYFNYAPRYIIWHAQLGYGPDPPNPAPLASRLQETNEDQATPVYVYEFSHPTEIPGFPACSGSACHTAELPYVFDNVSGAPARRRCCRVLLVSATRWWLELLGSLEPLPFALGGCS